MSWREQIIPIIDRCISLISKRKQQKEAGLREQKEVEGEIAELQRLENSLRAYRERLENKDPSLSYDTFLHEITELKTAFSPVFAFNAIIDLLKELQGQKSMQEEFITKLNPICRVVSRELNDLRKKQGKQLKDAQKNIVDDKIAVLESIEKVLINTGRKVSDSSITPQQGDALMLDEIFKILVDNNGAGFKALATPRSRSLSVFQASYGETNSVLILVESGLLSEKLRQFFSDLGKDGEFPKGGREDFLMKQQEAAAKRHEGSRGHGAFGSARDFGDYDEKDDGRKFSP